MALRTWEPAFPALTFTLTADGIATPLVTKTFTTLLSAENFFTDNAMNLGSRASGALERQPP